MRLGNEPIELPLSPLGHTWILDLDGTLVKHNGYKLNGHDSFVDGAKEFLDRIKPQDMVILLTSRTEDVRAETEFFLRENGVRYDAIIYNAPYGERILINDDKPSGLRMAVAVEKERDSGLKLQIIEDEDQARSRQDVI
ncbi:hypothetical protein [uncultured Dysosmobacter sp.]|uniref:hypothetical protein n=1 Tax=uncultured Dysosmobacter sp. TaxID=2591384 RepID=UPI002602D2A2|nr:hypothetical protein [uncultured Dysosmobacter sp.]